MKKFRKILKKIIEWITKEMKVNDNTQISLPIRNLVAIIGAVAIGVWAYFELRKT